jgi:hypothetical protein
MRRRVLLAALTITIVAPSTARGDEERATPAAPSFSAPWFFRLLAGGGGVPRLPDDDRAGNVVYTAEIGHRPVAGNTGGALSTGFSISSAADAKSQWSVITPGLFAQLDLTYVLLSGLWARIPPSAFPVRLELGSRLGLGISQSFRPQQDLPYAQSFLLLRPELMSYLQVDVPLDKRHEYVLLARGAIDTSVNLGELYRYSFTGGFAYCWGAP